MRVEAGLLSEEGGQAVAVDHFKFPAFGHIDAAQAVELDGVQIASQANGDLVGLVLGAAGKVELDAVAQVAKLLGAGHGKKAIAAKLGKDGLGDGGRHLVALR